MGSIQRILLIIALTFCYSPSFLFIKLAIQELPPMVVVSSRLGLSTFIFSMILLWKKRALPLCPRFWLHMLFLGTISAALPFTLFCFAERSIESSLAAVLNGTTPMFTALLAHFFIPTDRLHIQKVLGIFLSAVGLICLFFPNLSQGVYGSLPGIMAGLVASFCYGVSHVYAKKYGTGYPPFVIPTAQVLCGSLILMPFACYFDHPWDLMMPSYTAILGVCGLSLVGTVLAFILYYRLLEHSGPTAVSTVACFIPLGGMCLGSLFLGEDLSLSAILAATLILSGIFVVNEIINVKPLLARLYAPHPVETGKD